MTTGLPCEGDWIHSEAVLNTSSHTRMNRLLVLLLGCSDSVTVRALAPLNTS